MIQGTTRINSFSIHLFPALEFLDFRNLRVDFLEHSLIKKLEFGIFRTKVPQLLSRCLSAFGDAVSDAATDMPLDIWLVCGMEENVRGISLIVKRLIRNLIMRNIYCKLQVP